MSYLGTIGKRFQDSGLGDILIEAHIVAPGSIKGILSGHHYNISIRANKIMYEALVRLIWKAFLEASSADECDSALDLVKEFNEVGPTMNLFDITQQDRITAILTMYQSFIEKERLENPTFDYWSSYIDMVQCLLLFLRATREGDWKLHLASLRQILPWFSAYDRVNYARYLPAYISEMDSLSITHPAIIDSFWQVIS